MAEGQDSKKKINITVKTTKDKKTLEVEEDTSIKDVCSLFGEEVILIYSIMILRILSTDLSRTC